MTLPWGLSQVSVSKIFASIGPTSCWLETAGFSGAGFSAQATVSVLSELPDPEADEEPHAARTPARTASAAAAVARFLMIMNIAVDSFSGR